MKNITFIIALTLINSINAAASAGPGLRVEEKTVVWDNNNPLITATARLASNAATVAFVDNFCSSETFVTDYENKIKENSEIVEKNFTSLADDIRNKAMAFFNGVLKRVRHDYGDLLAKANASNNKKNGLLLGLNTDLTNIIYIPLPHPAGCNNVPTGKEQAACDLAKELANLTAEYEKQRALLVGVSRISRHQEQLVMFLTGATQLVKGGKILAADENLQALFTAYANPNSQLAQVYKLEALFAAQHLPDNMHPIYITTYSKLTYKPSAGITYPEHEKNEEVFDKAKILQALATQAEIQLLANQPAVAIPVVKKVRMFTEADDGLLKNIEDSIDQIDQVLKATGKTPAGWSINELVMDYGTVSGKTSINPTIRENVKALLANQLKRRGINITAVNDRTITMPTDRVPLGHLLNSYAKLTPIANSNSTEATFSGLAATAVALLNWRNNLGIYNPNSADYQAIDDVMFQIFHKFRNEDNSQNTHVEFLESLWQLYSMYEYYQKWSDNGEKQEHLSALKPFICSAFSNVIDHKGGYGEPLRCVTGARGRAFVVRLDMVRFLRNHHPEFAMQK